MHFNELVGPSRERYPAVVVTPIFEAANAGHALALHGGCAQLVATGSRRRDPSARSLFGSSSLNLIHHCQIPVVRCPFQEQDCH
jgi:nucleotide-binding universal stress UspA family protein